ncbi:MAG: hypothetical protein WDM89_07960 [Rhizomicrobium sp.]
MKLSFLFRQVAALLAFVVACMILPASASTLKTLYSFCSVNGCLDGLQPSSGLISDATGNLYGVTDATGGSIGEGLAYATDEARRQI